MANRYQSAIPPVPPSFFLSLTSAQQKQLTHLLNAYKIHYECYYSFSGEMLKKTGFVYEIWEGLIRNETVKQSGISKSMFRLLLFVYFLGKSPKFKDIRLTKDIIKRETRVMRYINRLWPEKNLKYLVKYGWLNVHLLRYRKKQYFVSEKGNDLIMIYGLKYAELFNNFFQPLSL
jgi:hypothetical protein